MNCGVFLRSIIDNPADDGPRLVYADWLEEQGQCDWAEFIRISMQLARSVEEWPTIQQVTFKECAPLENQRAEVIVTGPCLNSHVFSPSQRLFEVLHPDGKRTRSWYPTWLKYDVMGREVQEYEVKTNFFQTVTQEILSLA